MDVEVLSGVGAEITGVDVTNLTAAEFTDIQNVFAQQGLVFFRDQSLDEPQHIEFAQRWGAININRFFAPHEKYPQIAMVTKEPDHEQNIGGSWHTDHSYDTEPALGSILVAREVPKSGGDTWFTNMYRAFEALSPGLQETLLGLNAVHSAHHAFGTNSAYKEVTDDRVGNSEAADALEDVVHPAVITHPLSGRKALYVNPGFTRRFDGWSTEDSLALLKHLYAVARNEAFITKFHWRPGSIAFWDNRATWHFAQNDYQGDRRIMHRITIEGCALEAGAS